MTEKIFFSKYDLGNSLFFYILHTIFPNKKIIQKIVAYNLDLYPGVPPKQ